MERVRARSFFQSLQPIEPNAIQVAANRFASDSRSAVDPDPARRKISLSQGMLYNNKPRNSRDLEGQAINTRVGDLFDMAGARFALRSFGAYLLEHPNHTAYGNPKDEVLGRLEPKLQELVFGPDAEVLRRGQLATIPLVSQIDAFREALRLVQSLHADADTVVISTNGYNPHYGVLREFFAPERIQRFHLTDPDGGFNLADLERGLRGVGKASRAVVFLQASGQNFMGVNPTAEQERDIVRLLDTTGAIPFVDMAYQGLIHDLDRDASLIRLLAEETDLPMVVFESWSKKGKLYGLRVDFLHWLAGDARQAQTIRQCQHARIREKLLCVPPVFKIPYFLLADEEARRVWQVQDLPAAREILQQTRRGLAAGLGSRFEALFTGRQGMFSSFPITHEGIEALAEEYHIYAVKAFDEDRLDAAGRPTECARILCCVAEDALEWVSAALLDIYQRFPSRGRHALEP